MNLNWLKRSIWTGCLFFGGILVGTNLSRVAETPATVPLLQNAHVEVTRIEYPEKSVRSPHVRPRSQVIVFIDDAHYQVVERQGHVYPQYTNCLKYLLSLADLHLAKDEIY